MNIASLSRSYYDYRSRTFSMFDPQIIYTNVRNLEAYVIQPEDEMRIDRIIDKIYEQGSIGDLDILLRLNNIDNPLNLKAGVVLYYPNVENLDGYRYNLPPESSDKTVKAKLAAPNKTTKKDSNRKKFLDNGFILPPTVLDSPKEPVRIQGNQIVVGGIN